MRNLLLMNNSLEGGDYPTLPALALAWFARTAALLVSAFAGPLPAYSTTGSIAVKPGNAGLCGQVGAAESQGKQQPPAPLRVPLLAFS